MNLFFNKFKQNIPDKYEHTYTEHVEVKTTLTTLPVLR